MFCIPWFERIDSRGSRPVFALEQDLVQETAGIDSLAGWSLRWGAEPGDCEPAFMVWFFRLGIAGERDCRVRLERGPFHGEFSVRMALGITNRSSCVFVAR